jgi:hypothetical protein
MTENNKKEERQAIRSGECHHHDIVHQDEVHYSARGHFIPQLFHRSGPVVRGEEGGVGEDALLLTLDQPRHHLDVQRRVILQQHGNTSAYT